MRTQHCVGAILSFFLFSFTSTILAEGPQFTSQIVPAIINQPQNQVANGGIYNVTVTNPDGSATGSNSPAFAPTITGQPTNDSVVAGGTATFSVSVVGASPINYYWSFNNANVPGATNSTLTLTNVAISQAGNYSVFIINDYGSTNSSSAILTVYGVPPFIINEPVSQIVLTGGDATFSLAAGGTPPLSYQWNFNGTDISGATNEILTLTNVQPSQAGSYAATVNNAYGSTNSASATLSIISNIPAQFFDDFNGPSLNPIWQTNLPASAVCGSFQIGFFEIATNIGAPTYTFDQIDSNTVLNLHNAIGPQERVGWGSSANFLPGNFRYEARFNTLFLSSTTSVDGFFEIWIMNSTNNNLYFMISAYEGDFDALPYVFYGSSENNSYGANPYTFANNTWYRLALESLPGQDIRASLCDDNEHELFGVNFGYDGSAFGSGFKIVIAQNVGSSGTNLPAAVAVDYVSLASQFSPAIIDQPQNQTVPEGANATFSTVVEGPPPLNYQWYFNGVNIAGATNSIVTITNIQAANLGVYSLTVTNTYGSATSSSALLLTTSILAPTILSQPGNNLVVAGGAVTFSVSVTGASPLNYYWSFKNANIPGATNSTLSLTNVSPSQAGNYSVFTINDYGSTNSASATLTVIPSLPRLATTSSFGAFYISWPTNTTEFILVTTTNLISGNWVPVAVSPVQSGNLYVKPIIPSGSNAFYRLEFNGK